MRPPVELSRPTLLNIIAIICYCLSMMFHIIAYATDNWGSLLLDGVRWRVGLWHGCTQNTEDSSWHCGQEVFEHEHFKTGSDWHLGARIMMTIALIALFFLEFFVIGYTCIKRLERYKGTLVAIIIGLSLTAAFSHFLVMIMYGSEVNKIPDSSIQASFGVIVISFLLELAIPFLIHFDKTKRYPISRSFIETHFRKPKTQQPTSSAARYQTSTSTAGKSLRPATSSIEQPVTSMPGSMRTSVSSLSDAETFKKFAYIDPVGPAVLADMPASVRTSASSLSENDTYRRFSRLPEPEGSIGGSSLRTQSTTYTNVSYLPDEHGPREMFI